MRAFFQSIGTTLALFLLGLIFLTSPSLVMASLEEAVFAGGCFWCLEHDLEGLQGVISVDSGYTGGELENPTYREHQGHQEAVKVRFDSEQISYEQLLRSYWRNIDPLDQEGQFCDRGDSYRPVIFISGEKQDIDANQSLIDAATEINKPIDNIKVKVDNLRKFWQAEDYHQDFAVNNGLKYQFYRYSCGRDARLVEVWGKRARTGDRWTTDE